MLKNFFDGYCSFYFIGIGGVSMSGLAKYMLSLGKTVGGSDNFAGVYTDELIKAGADVQIGCDKKSVKDYDVIVYTDAIREDDLQLLEARELNKLILPRVRLLYEIGKNFKKVIAVAGCHGKTTCTAMLAHVFAAAGAQFCVHMGGRDRKFSNNFCNGNDFFITEACEYKKNFLALKPDVAVILNCAPDHLECYGSAENLMCAYKEFASAASVAITHCEEFSNSTVTFGYENARYHAKKITCKDGLYSFVAYDGDNELGTVSLEVYGKHNILNALAAIAVAREAEIPFARISEGLTEFSGVERRFEIIGKRNGAVCIADYAHHPEEIEATLSAAQKINAGKLYVVFQPHTYSRTKNLFGEFVSVLSEIENLMIYRTFAAREYFDDAGSALTLSQSLKLSRYGECADDIEDFISKATAKDIILFLGAGDIYDIAKAMFEE